MFPQRLDSSVQVDRIPEHNGGDDRAQASCPALLMASGNH
jgi:hypothetical protein